MKYALLVIEVQPNSTETEVKALWTLSREIENTLGASSQIIGVGSFLCDLSNGLGDLSRVHELAKASEISVRTLFFSENPAWIVSKFDDKTKPKPTHSPRPRV